MKFKVSVAAWSDRYVESLLEQHPASLVLNRQYITNAADRQDWPEMLRRAEQFRARRPHSAAAQIACVIALRHSGREAEATKLLRRLVWRLPRSIEVQLEWARDAGRRQDWAEATHRFAKLRRRFPQAAEGYIEGSRALLRTGHDGAAETLLEHSKGCFPKVHYIWQEAAQLVESQGDGEKALARWAEMRERFPNTPEGYIGGATWLMRLGRREEAAELIAQARDFFPGNATILAAVATLNAQSGES
ncbi:tetratricopeptide repeat protein [Telmatospirillum sp.]|uniref:tetratricopeptide repeat protein n=1 Tax=Telmatospirillum sp. TaxID=2079197 RepID=UPI00284049C9|nr:tetratricopeptide repeat protein [Telmatospirillum sp.]MDR3438721.1 tetratricopeptide repeat protein [Telmatospirillum sp.]